MALSDFVADLFHFLVVIGVDPDTFDTVEVDGTNEAVELPV